MKIESLIKAVPFCVLSCMLLGAVNGHAQTNNVRMKSATITGVEDNPFDFVRQTAESQDNLKHFQNKARGKTFATRNGLNPRANARKTAGALQYRKKFNGSSGEAKILRKTLVAQYGEPKSVRGQSHVWDIENPSRGGAQADIVTIIMQMDKSGDYELIMDRDRGEDGRATWAAPRIEKLTIQKKQPQKKQILPILQPDND